MFAGCWWARKLFLAEPVITKDKWVEAYTRWMHDVIADGIMDYETVMQHYYNCLEVDLVAYKEDGGEPTAGVHYDMLVRQRWARQCSDDTDATNFSEDVAQIDEGAATMARRWSRLDGKVAQQHEAQPGGGAAREAWSWCGRHQTRAEQDRTRPG